MFSRGVERSETPGNKCKIRCFRRNHLVARMMIPCRETIWGRARSPGVSLRSTTRLSLDFSLREKSSSLSARAVGAPGRAPALQGWDTGELPLAPTTACESTRRDSSGLSARRAPTCRLRHAHCPHGRTGSSAIRAHPLRRRWRSPRQTSPASPPSSSYSGIVEGELNHLIFSY